MPAGAARPTTRWWGITWRTGLKTRFLASDEADVSSPRQGAPDGGQLFCWKTDSIRERRPPVGVSGWHDDCICHRVTSNTRTMSTLNARFRATRRSGPRWPRRSRRTRRSTGRRRWAVVRACRIALSAGWSGVENAWVWLTVFGVRDAARYGLRQRKRVAVGLVVLVAMVYGGLQIGRIALPTTPEVEPAVTPGALPVLPVLPTRFDGVPLQSYLVTPAMADHHLHELLASPVLGDTAFARAVHGWVDYWTVAASRWFPGFLSRMASRGSAVDSALAIRGFPPSLRYLPLIESGYDPSVTSRSGAVGLWQLMPSTARALGLKVGPMPFRCWKTLTRKRETSGIL